MSRSHSIRPPFAEFVLESTLPDRSRFALNAEQWEAFQAALDAPTRPAAPRLERLLREPSVFETGLAPTEPRP